MGMFALAQNTNKFAVLQHKMTQNISILQINDFTLP